MIDQDKGTHAESAEPVLFLARGKNPFSLIRGAMETCSNRFKTFRLREEKTAPEFVDYLGWCTWDAFYKDVSEAKVLKGLRSFSKAGLIPGFMIIDDGWQDVENFRMQSFDANKKFKISIEEAPEHPDCISGQIMKGIKKPYECSQFGKKCKPSFPLGAPMVSSEGACAAYYHFSGMVEA